MTDEQIATSMAFKNAFSGEHGKKVLEVLDRRCMYKRPGMYQADSDRQTCFNLGMHEVILYIHQEIDRDLSKKETKAIHDEVGSSKT